jgi:predicted membrane protein
MRAIGRLIGVLAGLIAITAAAMAVTAQGMRRRLVRVDAPEANEVHLVSIFEPLLFHSTAVSFRGGTLDCWYGGGLVDLRDATLDPAGATLRVRTIFGGSHIAVPESWTVVSRVSGIGGVGDQRQHGGQTIGPDLVIEGTALFGGIGVSSEVPDAELRGLEQSIAAQAARR